MALTVKGASPKVWSGTALSVRFGSAAVTLKNVLTVIAENGLLATWVAVMMTLPTPVMVSDDPESNAGPLTDTVIAPLELDVTLTGITALHSGWAAIGAMTSVGASGATVKVATAVAEE